MTTRLECMINDIYMLVDAGWRAQDAIDAVSAYFEATEDERTDLNAYGYDFQLIGQAV